MSSRYLRRASGEPDEDELQYSRNMGPHRDEDYEDQPVAFTYGGNRAREQLPVASHEYLDENIAVEDLVQLATKLAADTQTLQLLAQNLELLDLIAKQGGIRCLSGAMGEMAIQLETQHEAIREEGQDFLNQVRTLMDSTTDALLRLLSMILSRSWKHQRDLRKKQRKPALEENKLYEWELGGDITRNQLQSPSDADDLERRSLNRLKLSPGLHRTFKPSSKFFKCKKL